MQTRRWRATWTEQDGTTQACTFVSQDNRVIAEMDFQTIRAYQNKPLPADFTLEEDRRVFQMTPASQNRENSSVVKEGRDE